MASLAGLAPPTRATTRVQAYLREHPSVRRMLALGLLNDAALARRIRSESADRLSLEAVAVALRRAERSGLDVDPTGVAARLLAGGTTLELRTAYSVLRVPMGDAELAVLLARPPEGPVAGRPDRTLLHVEEGAPFLSVARPSVQVGPLIEALPKRPAPERTDGLALVTLGALGPVSNTPGVIAFLAERLAERDLVPRMLAAAGDLVAILAPETDARDVFALLHDLRRGVDVDEPGGRAKRSSEPAPARDGGKAVARRRTSDPRSGAEIARAYVASHPSVADCLGYGIVNFTGLSRRISRELRYDRPDAVEAALRRWKPEGLAAESTESRILAVVHDSRIEVRTRVALVTAPPNWELLSRVLAAQPSPVVDRRRLFQVLQSPTTVTVLCDEDLVDPVLRAVGRRGTIEAHRELAAVVVRSPETILETPGVLAFLSGAVYRAGLNCLELMSLHLESTFVVRQADALATFGVLADLVHPGPSGGSTTSSVLG